MYIIQHFYRLDFHNQFIFYYKIEITQSHLNFLIHHLNRLLRFEYKLLFSKFVFQSFLIEIFREAGAESIVDTHTSAPNPVA